MELTYRAFEFTMGKFADKLTYKGDAATWYPASIGTLEKHLDTSMISCPNFPDRKITPLKKNIAYNLQYIEFLDRLIKDISLSSVLWTQNVKSFAVHSAAVIEAIFHYLIVSTGNATKTEWKSCNKLKSNEYQINGNAFMHETEIFIKADQSIIVEMTFDQMAKKVEAKKLLGDVGDLYKEISKIRKLRNKIHLHGIEDSTDTDYKNFNKSEYELTRRVLHGVLISPVFKNSVYQKCFDYLKNS
jgi:hypothetical protein